METFLPKVIFGTSSLGNLFVALPYREKLEIVKQCFDSSTGPVVFDTAGKYGAGLALEALGKCLKDLEIPAERVVISNKLGWYQTPLKSAEPTFEPGVWKDLKNDAVQKLSYDGILECFEQGNELLGTYQPQLVSIHDPDEYLANAKNKEEEALFYADILDAYEALFDLKKVGKVKAIGVGAKNWKVIERISKDVQLDWVMFANSLTIKEHPADLLNFVRTVSNNGVQVINSAIFHAGFLIGGDYYDYKLVKPDNNENKRLYQWRADFFTLCHQFNIKPAVACVQFALSVRGVNSIALNTSNPNYVKENISMAYTDVDPSFWIALEEAGLLSSNILSDLLNPENKMK